MHSSATITNRLGFAPENRRENGHSEALTHPDRIIAAVPPVAGRNPVSRGFAKPLSFTGEFTKPEIPLTHSK